MGADAGVRSMRRSTSIGCSTWFPPSGARARCPRAQPIDRDLAVVVDEATPVGELLRVARMSAGPLLADLRLFDAYRGEQVGPGRVSYALAFRFQPEDAG